MKYRCPSCKQSDALWEEILVSGWRDVDENLKPNESQSALARDVDWAHVESMGNYGCSCGWGPCIADRLERVGIDGEPLPVVHPNQLELAS